MSYQPVYGLDGRPALGPAYWGVDRPVCMEYPCPFERWDRVNLTHSQNAEFTITEPVRTFTITSLPSDVLNTIVCGFHIMMTAQAGTHNINFSFSTGGSDYFREHAFANVNTTLRNEAPVTLSLSEPSTTLPIPYLRYRIVIAMVGVDIPVVPEGSWVRVGIYIS